MLAFGPHRNVGSFINPASSRHTVRCALRRPAPPVVCPGFGLDRSINREQYKQRAVGPPRANLWGYSSGVYH